MLNKVTSNLSKMIVPGSVRGFATASIRDRFETAYVARKEASSGPTKV